jgi:hypothetical protein
MTKIILAIASIGYVFTFWKSTFNAMETHVFVWSTIICGFILGYYLIYFLEKKLPDKIKLHTMWQGPKSFGALVSGLIGLAICWLLFIFHVLIR